MIGVREILPRRQDAQNRALVRFELVLEAFPCFLSLGRARGSSGRGRLGSIKLRQESSIFNSERGCRGTRPRPRSLGRTHLLLGHRRSRLGRHSRLGRMRSIVGRHRSRLGRTRARLGQRHSRLCRHRSRLRRLITQKGFARHVSRSRLRGLSTHKRFVYRVGALDRGGTRSRPGHNRSL